MHHDLRRRRAASLSTGTTVVYDERMKTNDCIENDGRTRSHQVIESRAALPRREFQQPLSSAAELEGGQAKDL